MKAILLASLTMIAFSLSTGYAKSCPKCDEINRLRAEALKIKETDSEASQKRARNIIVKTSKLIDQHDVTSSNQEDVEEFRRLVVLVSDVMVFDPLMSVVDHLQTRMTTKKGNSRWSDYRSALPLIKNSCKRRFLEVVMKEFNCTSRISKPEDADKCVQKPAFDYKACMKKKKAK